MAQLRIAVDMDDVLADATGRFLEYAQQRLGLSLSKAQLTGRDWASVLGDAPLGMARQWLYEEGFFRGMAPLPHSQRVMERLHQQHEVFVVSAANEFPLSLKEKLEWMAEHFPFITWRHIVFCGHKHMIKADYLIDDHEKNLKSFVEGTPLLFSAPHNQHLQGYRRLNDWLEVEALFMG